jgi:hypothetical protein
MPGESYSAKIELLKMQEKFNREPWCVPHIRSPITNANEVTHATGLPWVTVSHPCSGSGKQTLSVADDVLRVPLVSPLVVLQSGVQLREKWDTGVGTSAPGLVGSGTTKAKPVAARAVDSHGARWRSYTLRAPLHSAVACRWEKLQDKLKTMGPGGGAGVGCGVGIGGGLAGTVGAGANMGLRSALHPPSR